MLTHRVDDRVDSVVAPDEARLLERQIARHHIHGPQRWELLAQPLGAHLEQLHRGRQIAQTPQPQIRQLHAHCVTVRVSTFRGPLDVGEQKGDRPRRTTRHTPPPANSTPRVFHEPTRRHAKMTQRWRTSTESYEEIRRSIRCVSSFRFRFQAVHAGEHRSSLACSPLAPHGAPSADEGADREAPHVRLTMARGEVFLNRRDGFTNRHSGSRRTEVRAQQRPTVRHGRPRYSPLSWAAPAAAPYHRRRRRRGAGRERGIDMFEWSDEHQMIRDAV